MLRCVEDLKVNTDKNKVYMGHDWNKCQISNIQSMFWMMVESATHVAESHGNVVSGRNCWGLLYCMTVRI